VQLKQQKNIKYTKWWKWRSFLHKRFGNSGIPSHGAFFVSTPKPKEYHYNSDKVSGCVEEFDKSNWEILIELYQRKH